MISKSRYSCLLPSPGSEKSRWWEDCLEQGEGRNQSPTPGGESSGFPQSRGEAEEVTKLGYRARELKCKYEKNRCVSEVLWI